MVGTHYSYTGVRMSCALQAKSAHFMNIQDRPFLIPSGDYHGIKDNPDMEYTDLKIIHSYIESFCLLFVACIRQLEMLRWRFLWHEHLTVTWLTT